MRFSYDVGSDIQTGGWRVSREKYKLDVYADEIKGGSDEKIHEIGQSEMSRKRTYF